MTPRPGTILRPTGRGALLLGLGLAAWVLGDLTRVVPARQFAAALLLMLLLGAIGIAVCGVGLRPRRRVVDDAVPVGDAARVQLELRGTAWITVIPLGRGVVREHLPAALGGQGDLPLDSHMPHVLGVDRRGRHELGPYSIIVRDVFGLFHLRRTVADDLRITGLPAITEMSPAAAQALGITREEALQAATAPGMGEIGPMARPYVSGDDVRRIHWRASARTGRLMTREEEPAAGRSAVIVLDTSRRAHPAPEVEERLLSHAATVLEMLGRAGWEVRILDASGDEITRTGHRHGPSGPSVLGGASDAVDQRASLLALADVAFDDDATGIGPDHAAGHAALAIALGPDGGEPFGGLELDRFAGRATRRTAIALGPALVDEQEPEVPRRTRRTGPADGDDFGHAHERHARQLATRPRRVPARSRHGAWMLVRGTTADSLTDLLTAVAEEDAA